jgi:TM2 domain-containing membrane protein YozV
MKNKFFAALLAFFLGSFGVHQFYLGNVGKGLFYLIFCWTGIATIISWIDGISLLLKDEDTFDEKYNKRYVNHRYYSQAPSLEERYNYSPTLELTPLEKIEELHTLKLRGLISEESYRREKTRILG